MILLVQKYGVGCLDPDDFFPEESERFLINKINDLPSVQLQPKVGHWIATDCDNAICSCCNRLNHIYGTYCKHCGAKMIEPQAESEG
jgi:hypothetical protein